MATTPESTRKFPKGPTLNERLVEKGMLKALHLLAPELHQAIAAFDNPRANEENPGDSHVPCPVHGGSDGFRMFTDAAKSGGAVCNTCGKFADAQRLLGWILAAREQNGTPSDFDLNDIMKNPYVQAAREELWHFVKTGTALHPDTAARTIRTVVEPTAEELAVQEAKRRENMKWIMGMASKMYQGAVHYDELITAYFKTRGLDNITIPSMMAVNHRVPYMVDKATPPTYYPTILMPVVLGPLEKAQARAMHRIFMQQHPDGTVTKAPVPSPKKILSWSDYGGAAIRLYPLNGSKLVVLAEGPETAVAVNSLTGLPAWSCVTAGNLAIAHIPDEVDTVLIAQDYDVSLTGQKACEKLAERVRAMGKMAFIVSPESFYDPEDPAHKKGIDWDDAIKMDRAGSLTLWEPYLGYGRDVPSLGSI